MPKKSFSVFDCDAHINDPVVIWKDYVEPEYREAVKDSYYVDERHGLLNGKQAVWGGQSFASGTSYNPICIAGPGINKKLLRRLQHMELTPEMRDYLEHKGAYLPHERIKEMDLMGIDQVLIIPTILNGYFPRVENAWGAHGIARAYNNWAEDYCKAVPDRLFYATWLPVQNPTFSCDEIERSRKMGSPVALIRACDQQRNYPNQIAPSAPGRGGGWDSVYRTLEEAGMVAGMHTFTGSYGEWGDLMSCPGQVADLAAETSGYAQGLSAQSIGFISEAMIWTAQMLLSGFLERYPKLKMAIYESNSTWLASLLEHLDRLYDLYGNERLQRVDRRPSEAFHDQCLVSFESDETSIFRRWDLYQDVAIWASDAYHHDGADSWSAIEEMEKVEVPESVQAKMLGGNARRFYGTEEKLCVTEAPESISRPSWFPSTEEVAEFAEKAANPRKHPDWKPQRTAAY